MKKELPNIILSSVLVSLLVTIVPFFGPLLSWLFTAKMMSEEKEIKTSAKVICLLVWAVSAALFSWVLFSILIKENSLMYVNLVSEIIILIIAPFMIFKK
jgi:hypothetical protein